MAQPPASRVRSQAPARWVSPPAHSPAVPPARTFPPTREGEAGPKVKAGTEAKATGGRQAGPAPCASETSPGFAPCFVTPPAPQTQARQVTPHLGEPEPDLKSLRQPNSPGRCRAADEGPVLAWPAAPLPARCPSPELPPPPSAGEGLPVPVPVPVPPPPRGGSPLPEHRRAPWKRQPRGPQPRRTTRRDRPSRLLPSAPEARASGAAGAARQRPGKGLGGARGGATTPAAAGGRLPPCPRPRPPRCPRHRGTPARREPPPRGLARARPRRPKVGRRPRGTMGAVGSPRFPAPRLRRRRRPSATTAPGRPRRRRRAGHAGKRSPPVALAGAGHGGSGSAAAGGDPTPLPRVPRARGVGERKFRFLAVVALGLARRERRR